jgi:hypothetical protein
VVAGQGQPTPTGLEIRQPGPQGVAVVQAPVQRMVRAALYSHLSWQVRGLEPDRRLHLVWVTLAEPRKSRELTLPPAGPDGIGELDLRAEPHWQGRIAALGLIVPGPFSQPLLLDRLELRPASLTFGDLLRWAWEEWTSFEDWSQRSINYTAGAPLDALFPPVLMVALWVGFGGLLYALLDPPRRRKLTPYAALFLLGWLVLDLRWQWDLHLRLEQTVERFAGKNEEERRLAALDGDLYRFLLEVRQRLPERPTRLFIVSADPQGFQVGPRPLSFAAAQRLCRSGASCHDAERGARWRLCADPVSIKPAWVMTANAQLLERQGGAVIRRAAACRCGRRAVPGEWRLKQNGMDGGVGLALGSAVAGRASCGCECSGAMPCRRALGRMVAGVWRYVLGLLLGDCAAARCRHAMGLPLNFAVRSRLLTLLILAAAGLAGCGCGAAEAILWTAQL